jgi:hypothetical protein
MPKPRSYHKLRYFEIRQGLTFLRKNELATFSSILNNKKEMFND